MKISNEARIGILAILAIAIFIFSFNYLKGKNVLSRALIIYAEYDNVDGLNISAPVKINGFQIGVVSDLKLANTGLVKATLNLQKDVQIPKDAVAKIVQYNPLAGKEVAIVYDKPCTDNCVKSGDEIKGRMTGMLESFFGDTQPVVDKLTAYAARLDSTFTSMSSGDGINVGALIQNIQNIVANLSSITTNLDKMVKQSSGNLNATLENFNAISENLKKNNDQITQLLANTAAFSTQLKDLNLKGISGEVEGVARNVNQSVTGLKKTLDEAQVAIQQLNVFIKQANSSEGTLGMLINDEQFANQLRNTFTDLELLSQDLRLNPKRYTNVLKKKSPAYTLPKEDPAAKLKQAKD